MKRLTIGGLSKILDGLILKTFNVAKPDDLKYVTVSSVPLMICLMFAKTLFPRFKPVSLYFHSLTVV